MHRARRRRFDGERRSTLIPGARARDREQAPVAFAISPSEKASTFCETSWFPELWI